MWYSKMFSLAIALTALLLLVDSSKSASVINSSSPTDYTCACTGKSTPEIQSSSSVSSEPTVKPDAGKSTPAMQSSPSTSSNPTLTPDAGKSTPAIKGSPSASTKPTVTPDAGKSTPAIKGSPSATSKPTTKPDAGKSTPAIKESPSVTTKQTTKPDASKSTPAIKGTPSASSKPTIKSDSVTPTPSTKSSATSTPTTTSNTTKEIEWKQLQTGGRYCKDPMNNDQSYLDDRTPNACKKFCAKYDRRYCAYEYEVNPGYCIGTDHCSDKRMPWDGARYLVWEMQDFVKMETGGRYCKDPKNNDQSFLRDRTQDGCKKFCKKYGRKYCAYEYKKNPGYCINSDHCSDMRMPSDSARYIVWKRKD